LAGVDSDWCSDNIKPVVWRAALAIYSLKIEILLRLILLVQVIDPSNFFLRQTDISLLILAIFLHMNYFVPKPQAEQRKSENEEKQRLVGLTPDDSRCLPCCLVRDQKHETV
jgi:hypothetical protein